MFQKILVQAFSTEVDITPTIVNNIAQANTILESQSINFICISMPLDDGDGITFTKKVRSTKQ